MQREWYELLLLQDIIGVCYVVLLCPTSDLHGSIFFFNQRRERKDFSTISTDGKGSLFWVVLGVFILQISWKNTHPTHTTYTHLIVILLRPANNNRHHPGSPTLHPLHVARERLLRFKNIKVSHRLCSFITMVEGEVEDSE